MLVSRAVFSLIHRANDNKKIQRRADFKPPAIGKLIAIRCVFLTVLIHARLP